MASKVIVITQTLEAKRIASMHLRLVASIERLQANHTMYATKNPAEIDNLVEEGFKDCRALEAGYLALTGQKLNREAPR